MPKYLNEEQNFRHRGFDDIENNKVIMIFGDAEAPKDSQGQPLKKLWDHDVKSVIAVADHIEPDPAPAPADGGIIPPQYQG